MDDFRNNRNQGDIRRRPVSMQAHKLPSAAELAALQNKKPAQPAQSVTPSQQQSRPAAQPAVSQPSGPQPVRKPQPRPMQTSNTAPLDSVQPQPLFEERVNQERVRTSKKRPAFLKRKYFIIMALVIILIVGGIVIYKKTHKEEVLAARTDKPVAQQVDESLPEKVTVPEPQAGNLTPSWLTIPKLNISTQVNGVNENSGKLAGPTNIFKAGWDSASAKPGEPGATVINGYLHGPNKPGVFYTMKQLVANDLIQVERVDGKILNYRISQVKLYEADKPDLSAARNSGNGSSLSLVAYSDAAAVKNRYNEQITVFASLVK